MQTVLYYCSYVGFVILSIIMLAYVSMASYLGPFISPLVLILYFKLFLATDNKALFVQSACQSGALFCTAVGFVLPTVFFADPIAWKVLLSKPLQFCIQIFLIGIGAGLLGTFVAWNTKTESTNPTSRLIFSIFKSLGRSGQDLAIFLSGLSSSLITIFRITCESITRAKFCSFLMPTILAIGLISGTKILASICTGAIFKILFGIFQTQIMAYTGSPDSLLTIQQFCLGALGWDLLTGLSKFIIKNIFKTNGLTRLEKESILTKLGKYTSNLAWLKATLLVFMSLICSGILISTLQIPLTLALLTIVITIICAQELSKIVASIGLAPLGRFATFAMLGSMLFKQSKEINVFIACFCALACAASANTVLQMAIAKLAKIEEKQIIMHHIVGLILASLGAGMVFLIFFKTMNFQHGIALAQRAQMRAILMQSWTTKPFIIIIGAITAIAFKLMRIEIAMFFAGLLMNVEQTIVFILGSILGALIKKHLNTEKLNSICSGLLLGESIVIFGSMVVKIIVGSNS